MDKLQHVQKTVDKLASSLERDERWGLIEVNWENPEMTSEESQRRMAEFSIWSSYSRELKAIKGRYHEEYLDNKAYQKYIRHMDLEKAVEFIKGFHYDYAAAGHSIREKENDGKGLQSKYSVVNAMEWVDQLAKLGGEQ